MPRQSKNARTRLAVLIGCLIGTLVAPASALAADDLVVLDGDPAPLLQGTLSYAKVYINSTLRLTGNTVLNVDSLYIGPRAQLQSCWVPAPANPLEAGDAAGCVNGRSLTIRSRGSVQITPAITLQGGNGPSRAGGSLLITGSAVTLGGAVNTSGTGGLNSGTVTLGTGGLLRVQSIAAPGAAVSLTGSRGVSSSADIDVRPYNGGPAAAGFAPSGGSVTVGSSAGNISIRSSVLSDGASAGGAGLFGGTGGPVNIQGGDVRVGNVQTSGGATQDLLGGNAGSLRIGARGRATIGSLTANGGGGGTGRAGQAAGIDVFGARKVIIGSASASGPAAAIAGGNGGTVRVHGAAIVATGLAATGGNGTNGPANPSGGLGGRIEVIGSGRVLVPGLAATGGNGGGLGPAGRGGSVTVTGTRVQIAGAVSTSGGDGVDGPAGAGGTIALGSSVGSLRVLGGLDAGGSPSTTNVAAGAGRVTASAKGPMLIIGQVNVQGANGASGGSAGGSVVLRGPQLDLLTGFAATGGNGTAPGAPGGRGATIDVRSGGDLVLQGVSVAGGNGNGAGAGGGGGGAILSAVGLRLFGGVDVTGGTSGTGSGGTTGGMSLKATGPLTVAGTLDASGTNGPSAAASAGGKVTIVAGGDGYIGGINVSGANGATGGTPAGTVVLRGPSIDLGTMTAGGGSGTGSSNGGRGGTIDISTSGDFTTFGSLAPAGGSGAGAGVGGAGGTVAVAADDIAVGGVDVTGGPGGTATGGAAGRARLVAYGDLHVQNAVDASGTGAGAGGAAGDGGGIYLRAGNTVTAGSVSFGGAGGGLRGGNGSRFDLLAHDATIGNITGDGGSGAGAAANPAGGRGGTFVGRLTGRFDAGALSFRGGAGGGLGTGNNGGVIDVSAADIDVASAATPGGGGGNRGASGGPIRLDATGDLTVVGTVQTDGAQGAAAPGAGLAGFIGGGAGKIVLRAADGNLSLAQGVTALGGRAGEPGAGVVFGAVGGRGGAVDIIARHVGALQGIETTGGDGSGPQDTAGAGGDGGVVRVWSDDGVLDGSRFVATGGGVGIPGGLEGVQSPEQSPSDVALSKATVAFSLRSPDAARIGLIAQTGPQAGLVVSSSGVAGPLKAPKPLVCVAVRYSVVGLMPTLGWISNPGGVVRAKAAKSKSCRAAPVVTAVGRKVVVSLTAIAPTGYGARITTRVKGLGTVRAEALNGTAVATSATAAVLRNGRVAVDLHLPPALRKPGVYTVRLTGRALVGNRSGKKTTITLEVRP